MLRNANIHPDDISYVEMHGKGTQVGDPAEISAVGNLLKYRRPANRPVPVGSVKANFGRSEAAAGMASLLKCIKMFSTDTIPPQAGMPHALNPRFPPLSELNIQIPSEPKPYEKHVSQPRRILLNLSCYALRQRHQRRKGDVAERVSPGCLARLHHLLSR